MEKQKKQEWYSQAAKFQEEVHNREYRSKDDHYHYTVLEHEYVVLFDKFSGEHKIVKPNLEITGDHTTA